MIVVGHVGGMPFEEWLAPLLLAGGTTVLGVRAALHRFGTGVASRRASRRRP